MKGMAVRVREGKRAKDAAGFPVFLSLRVMSRTGEQPVPHLFQPPVRSRARLCSSPLIPRRIILLEKVLTGLRNSGSHVKMKAAHQKKKAERTEMFPGMSLLSRQGHLSLSCLQVHCALKENEMKIRK